MHIRKDLIPKVIFVDQVLGGEEADDQAVGADPKVEE